jgi:hypothetical protein
MKPVFLLLLIAVFVGEASLQAQLPGANQPGLNAALLKILGEVIAFSSSADVRLTEKGSKDSVSMTVGFAMLDRKVRMDVDMNTVKSKQISPETLASFKAAGMDKVTTILLPDKKLALLVYPLTKCYVELPMGQDEAADLNRKYKLNKTPLGRERIGSQTCDKTKVVVSADNGANHEATVWYAPALQNFPVQVEMDQPGATVVLQYRDVKLVRPDAGQFEAPAGFAKYPSVEQLMQNAMLKMLKGNKQPR